MRRLIPAFIFLVNLLAFGCAYHSKEIKTYYVHSHKEHPPSYLYYYFSYLFEKSRGNYEKALEEIKKAVNATDSTPEVAVESARFCAELKKYKLAEFFAKKALEKDPLNAPALRILAGIKVVEGEFEEAEKLYQKAISVSKDRENFILLANLYINERKLKDAEKVLKKALYLYPDDYLVNYFLAQLRYLQGKKERALFYLQRSITQNSHFGSAYVLLGKIMSELGNYELAEETLKEILKKSPNNVHALKELLLIYAKTNRVKDALEVIDKIVELEPYNLKLLSWVAASLFKMGEYKEVIPIIERISKLNPDNPNVYLMLGIAKEMTGDLKGALSAYERSLEYYADNPAVLERISACLIKMERFEEAKAYLERLWEMTKETKYLIRIAILLDKLYGPEESFKVLNVWKEKLESDPTGLYYYAYFADRAGYYQTAENLLRKLVKISPSPDNFNYLAYFLAQRGKDLEEALKYVDKALEEEPENPAFIDTKGWIFFKMGKYEKSCKLLKKALSLKPDDPVINEHVGECLFFKGNLVESVKYLQKALEGIEKDPSILKEEKGLDKRIKAMLDIYNLRAGEKDEGGRVKVKNSRSGDN